MSWNVQGSMRGAGVPMAPGMLDIEVVVAGTLKAQGAIVGLFQKTGLQDPQGMVHMENQWRHRCYQAFLGVVSQLASAAAVRSGLLIDLRADVFSAEEVRDVVDFILGKAMSLHVVTAGETFTVINVHGPGSGGDLWASNDSFWADVAMYAAAKSAGGTRPVLIGGDFNMLPESPRHTTKRRFVSSCRRQCTRAYTPIWRRCSGQGGGRCPDPTPSRVGTSAFSPGPARTRRCSPLLMTFYTRGSHATSLGTELFSSRSVTRTICTFLKRGLGSVKWTTYGSQDSATSSDLTCPVP